MMHHPDSQDSGRASPFSRLDWPSPQMLARANRARSEALRDMTLEIVRWVMGLASTPRATITAHTKIEAMPLPKR